jgi:peptidyl-prolyl cis-trans isomerase C
MNPLKTQNILTAVLAVGLWSLQPSAGAASPGADASDTVVASGKGFVIKRSQLDAAFINYSESMAASGRSISDGERDEAKEKLLDHLVMTKILDSEATPDQRAEIKKLVDTDIDTARKAAPSPEAFDNQLKANGMTLDEVRNRAYEEQLARRVLEFQTTNGITVSEADAKKFYDENPDKFEVPEQVHVAHILISTLEPPDPLNPRSQPDPLPPDQKKAKEKLAREVKARADKGEDFGNLVKLYSDDTGSKEKKGEYTFARGQMVPEFEAAAFSLKTNQISDLVETRYGYHIIKLLEKLPGRHEPFFEVKDRIEKYLVEKEAQKKLPGFLDKIRAEYNVALLDPITGKLVPQVAK